VLGKNLGSGSSRRASRPTPYASSSRGRRSRTTGLYHRRLRRAPRCSSSNRPNNRGWLDTPRGRSEEHRQGSRGVAPGSRRTSCDYSGGIVNRGRRERRYDDFGTLGYPRQRVGACSTTRQPPPHQLQGGDPPNKWKRGRRGGGRAPPRVVHIERQGGRLDALTAIEGRPPLGEGFSIGSNPPGGHDRTRPGGARVMIYNRPLSAPEGR